MVIKSLLDLRKISVTKWLTMSIQTHNRQACTLLYGTVRYATSYTKMLTLNSLHWFSSSCTSSMMLWVTIILCQLTNELWSYGSMELTSYRHIIKLRYHYWYVLRRAQANIPPCDTRKSNWWQNTHHIYQPTCLLQRPLEQHMICYVQRSKMNSVSSMVFHQVHTAKCVPSRGALSDRMTSIT